MTRDRQRASSLLRGAFSASLLVIGLTAATPAASLCITTVPDGCNFDVPDSGSINVVTPLDVPLLSFDLGSIAITRAPSTLTRFEAGRSAARSVDSTLASRTHRRMGSAIRIGDVHDSNVLGLESSALVKEGEYSRSTALEGLSSFVTASFDSSERSFSDSRMGDVDATSQNVIAGVDYRSNSEVDWLVGVAAIYGVGEAEFEKIDDGVDSRTATVAAYGSVRPMTETLPGLQLDASFSFGWVDLDEYRSVSDGSTLSEDIDSQNLSARLLAGYEIGVGLISLRPQLGVEFFRNHVEAAKLDGGLRGRSHDSSTLYGSVGLQADAAFRVLGSSVRPSVNVRYMRSLRERYDDLVLVSQGAEFAVQDLAKTDDYVVVRAGLAIQLWRTLDANLGVDQVVANDDLRASTLTAGMHYAF